MEPIVAHPSTGSAPSISVGGKRDQDLDTGPGNVSVNHEVRTRDIARLVGCQEESRIGRVPCVPWDTGDRVFRSSAVRHHNLGPARRRPRQRVCRSLSKPATDLSAVDIPQILPSYLVINGFFGVSSGGQSLNEVFSRNSDPVLEPTVSRE